MTSKLHEDLPQSLVALGGNLPWRQEHAATTLRKAVAALAQNGVLIRRISRFFSSPSVPAGAGPDYVNAVMMVQSDRNASEMLGLLQAVEAQFDRERKNRWGARTIDLDLLDFNGCVQPTPATQMQWMQLEPSARLEKTPAELILPHPRLQDRAFVLVPLTDIAPEWRHPTLKLSAMELLEKLPASEIEVVRPI